MPVKQMRFYTLTWPTSRDAINENTLFNEKIDIGILTEKTEGKYNTAYRIAIYNFNGSSFST